MRLSGKFAISANIEQTTGISILRPEADRQLSATTGRQEQRGLWLDSMRSCTRCAAANSRDRLDILTRGPRL